MEIDNNIGESKIVQIFSNIEKE